MSRCVSGGTEIMSEQIIQIKKLIEAWHPKYSKIIDDDKLGLTECVSSTLDLIDAIEKIVGAK
jgi:hypothetical protein